MLTSPSNVVSSDSRRGMLIENQPASATPAPKFNAGVAGKKELYDVGVATNESLTEPN